VIGQLQRQHHVLQRRVAGQELERLEHEADLQRAQPCARVLVQREQVRAVDLDRPALGVSRPARIASSVDLPEPEAPTTATPRRA